METAALAEKTASADFEQLASQYLEKEPAQQAETVGKQLEQSVALAALGPLVETVKITESHNFGDPWIQLQEANVAGH